ncbi:hypothetical protein ACQVA2_05020 [Citrobacter sp. OP27]
MLSTLLLAYQDEIHVKLFRIWFIINNFGLNKAKRKILSIDKLHLLDFILQNEEILNHLNTAEKKDAHSTLYKSNLSYGAQNDIKPTIFIVELLHKKGFIEIETIDNTFYCTCTKKDMLIDKNTLCVWNEKAKKIKPLVNKPISSISKMLCEAEL